MSRRAVALGLVLVASGGCLATSDFDGLEGGSAAGTGGASGTGGAAGAGSSGMAGAGGLSGMGGAGGPSGMGGAGASGGGGLSGMGGGAGAAGGGGLSGMGGSGAAGGGAAGAPPGGCCLGAPCLANGRCAPVKMGTGVASATAVLGAHVYWGNLQGDELRRAPRSAPVGTPSETFAPSEANPENLRARGEVLYFTTWQPNTYQLRSVVPGSAPMTVAQGAGHVTGMSLDDTFAYVTIEGTQMVGNPNGMVAKIELASGTVTPLIVGTLEPSPTSPELDATVAGSFVHWVSRGSPGKIRKTDVSGFSAALDVAVGQPDPERLQVRDGVAYWTARSAGAIRKKPLASGGTEDVVASGQNGPESLLLSGDTLYWANRADGGPTGAIMRMTLPSGTPETLADGLRWPAGLALDEWAIYWGNYYGEGVYRVGLCACTP